MVTANTKIKTYQPIVYKDDLVQASKAIHDQLKSNLDERFDGIELEIGMRMLKSMENRFDKALEADFSKRLAIVQDMHTKQLEQVKQHYDKWMNESEVLHQKNLELMDQKYREKIGFLEASYQSGLQQIQTLLEKLQLPTPIINVDASQRAPDVVVNVPTLELPIPQVNVNVPAVELPVPQVTVNVPNVDMPIPQVTVNIPEQPAPVVNVEAPKAKKSRKFIEYDEYSRPATITEQEE